MFRSGPRLITIALSLLACQVLSSDAQAAQTAEAAFATSLCEQPVPAPAQLPPADSGPVVYLLGLCFLAQGNVSLVEPATYLSYVQLRPSRPSQNEWMPYDDQAIDVIKADFARLWATNFLDDLRIETSDYVFSNGVVGKLITYHLEERQRVKKVSYEGSKRLDRSKLEEQLRKDGHELRLDSFLDTKALRTVENAIREQLGESGLVDAEVTHTLTPLPDGPKLVDIAFNIVDGPTLMIRDVQFVGNHAISDAALESAMKHNRPQGLLSKLNGRGRYKDVQFAEDAQQVEDYYHDRGYVDARVGVPELRPLYQSPDGSTRWIQLRIPLTEGRQYHLARLDFEGNTVVKSELLRPFFKLKSGDLYSQQSIRDGFQKAREVYGAGGYMEFTGYPEIQPTDADANAAVPASITRADEHGHPAVPTVNVILHLSEGSQYFVNRIIFSGNVTTQDAVIRREVQLLEGGVFNTEALKSSVRRLNQLGYFKPIEGSEKDLKVEKADRGNTVNVSLKVEEQNRNQLSFGAGFSEYDGAFGNISFTTANFLGRGESVTLSAQKGARASNYQLSFTEPAVAGSPVSAGFNLFSSKVDYLSSANVVGYSQVREGAGVTLGRRVTRFSRLFVNYTYEIINTSTSDEFANSALSTANSTYYGLAENGQNSESRVSPSFEYNTVDNPLRPRSGYRLTATLPIAGGLLGGHRTICGQSWKQRSLSRTRDGLRSDCEETSR